MTPPTPSQIAQARRSARITARRGLPITTCPYAPQSPLGAVWVATYLALRPPAPGTVAHI